MPGEGAVVSRGAPPAGKGTAASGRQRHRFRAPAIKPPRWLRWVVIALCLVPATHIGWGLWSDLYRDTRVLGANPIETLEHQLGIWNIRFLVLTLAVTPVMRTTGWGWLIRYRRIFGLVAFFYISLHLSVYFVLDVELSWGRMVEDVAERLYITLGMTGFLMLVPLAVTSTKGWIRRMGNRRWNALHWLVFPAVMLGMTHYYMAVKRDVRAPLVYAAIFAVLFGYRIRARQLAARKKAAA